MERILGDPFLLILSFLDIRDISQLEISGGRCITDSHWEILVKRKYHLILQRIYSLTWKEKCRKIDCLFNFTEETILFLSQKLCWKKIRSINDGLNLFRLEQPFVDDNLIVSRKRS